MKRAEFTTINGSKCILTRGRKYTKLVSSHWWTMTWLNEDADRYLGSWENQIEFFKTKWSPK